MLFGQSFSSKWKQLPNISEYKFIEDLLLTPEIIQRVGNILPQDLTSSKETASIKMYLMSDCF